MKLRPYKPTLEMLNPVLSPQSRERVESALGSARFRLPGSKRQSWTFQDKHSVAKARMALFDALPASARQCLRNANRHISDKDLAEMVIERRGHVARKLVDTLRQARRTAKQNIR